MKKQAPPFAALNLTNPMNPMNPAQPHNVMQNLIFSAGDRSQASMAAMPSIASAKTAHFTPGQPGHAVLEVPDLSTLAGMIAALKASAKPAKKKAKLVTLMGIVLDESGSMGNGCAQTMKGYNDALETLRPSAEEIGCRITQVSFASQANVMAKDVQVKHIVPLSRETYNPMGGTALFDTVAGVVQMLLAHPLAQDDNTSVLLSITTDGDDTASTTWKTRGMAEFRALMQAVSANERWSVALAGPDDKLREFADLMCVAPENVAAFKPDSVQSRAHASDAGIHAMSAYSTLRASGMKKMDMLYAGTVANVSAMAILNQDKAS